jgi:D-xylulose reductase
MTSNPSLVLNKIDDISFEVKTAPQITDDHDVIVEVKKTGICASDIHYYAHGRIGDFVVHSPMVLGHESAGIVSQVGSKVTNVKVGDKVAIEPGVPSRLSDEYKQGKYNLCPCMVFAATPAEKGQPNPQGTLCRYFKSPEDFLVKLPPHVSLEMGALTEPLTVGVHANRRAATTFGDNVVVFGAGPVGLLNGIVARAFGAKNVMIVDIFDNKLQMAKDIGAATHTFNSKTEGDADALVKKFGLKPNVILECTGAEPCISMGIKIAKVGATMVQVGNAASDVKVPVTQMSTKEMSYLGTFRYGYNDYRTAVGILDENYKDGKENARFDFEALITDRFKWEDAIKAYDLARAGTGSVKVMIDGPEDDSKPKF